MKRLLARVVPLCFIAASHVTPSSAFARESVSSSTLASESAQRLNVDVMLVARASSEGSLAERIRSWFGAEAELSIAAEPLLSAERVLATPRAGHVGVWVTLRSITEARLYFAAPGEGHAKPRYLVRDVPVEHGLDEVGSERIAQVVHSSVSALIEGAVEGTERPVLERALEVAPPRASAPARTTPEPVEPVPSTLLPARSEPMQPAFLLGGFYRAALAGDEGVAHGPGVALGFGVESETYALALVGRGSYVLPRSRSFKGLALRLAGPWARAGLRLGRALAGLRCELELGAGFDWVRREATAPRESELIERAAATDRRSFFFASLGASYAFGSIRFAPRLELSGYANRTRYLVADGGRSHQELAASSRLQPALLVEALYD